MAWLPDTLPKTIKPIWSIDVGSNGLGGVAATSEYVIYSERGLNDTVDVFRCLSADTGKEIWNLTHPAVGNFDYGNSSRATPIIDGNRVYLFSAFGALFCVELETGKSIWEMDLRAEFEPKDMPKWGACSTPLLIGEKIIVNPGAADASLVALNALTGKVIWKTAGKPAGYGSLILAKLGGIEQIIGHDKDSLNGWDVKTGKRLWRVEPENPNDFNVPTPIVWNEKLIVSTENNGTRLFQFLADGIIDPKPIAQHKKLAPDTHTPIMSGDRLFGVWRRLYCLDLKKNLNEQYEDGNTSFAKYCAAVATDTRVMVISMESELILLDAQAEAYKELGRVKVLPNEKGLYSHPAFVGKRCYLRGSSTLVAFSLAE